MSFTGKPTTVLLLILLIQSDHLYLLTDSPVLLRVVQVLIGPLIHKQASYHIQPVLAEIPPRYNLQRFLVTLTEGWSTWLVVE